MRWRIHQTTSSVVVTSGVITAFEKNSGRRPWAIPQTWR